MNVKFCGNPQCELGLHEIPAHPGFGVRIRKAGMEIIISHQTVSGKQYCDCCAKKQRDQQYLDDLRFRATSLAGKSTERSKK